jgi:hypothetical protein
VADDPVWQSQTAFSELLAIASDDVLARDVSDTTDDAAGTVKRLALDGLLASIGVAPGGRLTLESGVPVSTSNQTAKGTLYYTPHVHDWVRLYDGTRPKLYQFTERSLSLTLTSGKNYDVFLFDSSGTLTLELSAAWTNDTTRADALAWQTGVGYVKSGTATRLWLGTIRASATNQTELVFGGADTAARSFIWNAHNRVRGCFAWRDSTDSWTYTTATWRQKRASSNNQIAVVAGAVGGPLEIHSQIIGYNPSASLECGIGYDSTSALATNCLIGRIAPPEANNPGASTSVARWAGYVGLGYHYAVELEACFAASGTATFYGDIGDGSRYQSGAIAAWEY